MLEMRIAHHGVYCGWSWRIMVDGDSWTLFIHGDVQKEMKVVPAGTDRPWVEAYMAEQGYGQR